MVKDYSVCPHFFNINFDISTFQVVIDVYNLCVPLILWSCKFLWSLKPLTHIHQFISHIHDGPVSCTFEIFHICYWICHVASAPNACISAI